MAYRGTPLQPAIAGWHRNLLAAAAVCAVLLIGMGSVLCVTQSIRSCPDWPGCFGQVLPPLQAGPILEMSHRLLAGATGLLVLGAGIAGLVRARGQGWILLPPLIAMVLVVEVSVLGALVVVGGISRGWAAVDVGSALLVVALLVAAACAAGALRRDPTRRVGPAFRSPEARLALVTAAVVWVVLLSGVLVAGDGSITACIGWPLYSPRVVQGDLPGAATGLRLALSAIGIVLVLAVLAQAWTGRRQRPAVYRAARWAAAAFALEAVLQGLLLVFGLGVALLIPYGVMASIFWALLVKTAVVAGLEERPGSDAGAHV